MATRRPGPLVVIVGETASGKSELAFKLAKKLDGEIICADALTIYKGFDIGAAKPTAAEQRIVHHYLLDEVNAGEAFSAAKFQKLALTAMEEISASGKLPIMVGGSGLYIDSVLFGYSFLPAGPPEIRNHLNSLTLKELLIEAKKNNLPLEGVDKKNKRRLIRLIENSGNKPKKSGLRPNAFILGLALPRDELKARITARVDRMLKEGLEQEVRDLVERYGWDVEPMKGVGYREWRGYLQSSKNLAEVRQSIIKSTTSLAKKQRTWFRRSVYENCIHWLDYKGNLEDAVELITTKLNNKI